MWPFHETLLQTASVRGMAHSMGASWAVHILNSLKGVIKGIIWGTTIGDVEGVLGV